MDILSYLTNRVTGMTGGTLNNPPPPPTPQPPSSANDEQLRNMMHRGADYVFDRTRFGDELRAEMEQMNAEFDEMRRIMGPMFRDIGGDLNQLGSVIDPRSGSGPSGIAGLIGDFPSDGFTSTSTSLSIVTLDDGTLQETRSVRTIGPDGVPREETSVRNIDTSSELPIHRPFGVQSSSSPRNEHPRTAFLTNVPIPTDSTPPGLVPRSFEMPEYAQDFSDKVNDMIRPYK